MSVHPEVINRNLKVVKVPIPEPVPPPNECLLPAPDCPNTKLSGLKICPKAPDLTESIVPGSKSTNIARGTYLAPVASLYSFA
uniref:Uncharacterized protein n=1 Tax=Glossina palpalis gambiensis TaxID=67801 RepID=A0A1B0BQ51_9MUSC